jgi:hypothetical protein
MLKQKETNKAIKFLKDRKTKHEKNPESFLLAQYIVGDVPKLVKEITGEIS